MKAEKVIERLRKVMPPEMISLVYEELSKMEMTDNRLITKYGKKIEISQLQDDAKNLLSIGIIVGHNENLYLLPFKVDGRELKLYYRAIK